MNPLCVGPSVNLMVIYEGTNDNEWCLHRMYVHRRDYYTLPGMMYIVKKVGTYWLEHIEHKILSPRRSIFQLNSVMTVHYLHASEA